MNGEELDRLRWRRFHDVAEREDGRSPFVRDRDRVLYSDELRRLGGVTQVISPSERQLIHTRLTHSLEVAQIARAVTDRVLANAAPEQIVEAGGLDVHVVEAAALVHDLGHPPFGHVTEGLLNSLLQGRKYGVADGFEGNAQSFRIVTKLSVRSSRHVGLNLTRATLAATLKYPWLVEDADVFHKKWGSYNSESEEFHFARGFCPQGTQRTLEAEIMDWSDDIAYAVHDAYDFVRAGLIPLARLISDKDEQAWVVRRELERTKSPEARYDDLLAALDRVFAFAQRRLDSSRRALAALHEMTSALVDRYISAVEFTGEGFGERAISIDQQFRDEVAMLKGLTWQYVITGQALATQRIGQRQLITSLFRILIEAAQSEKERAVFAPVVQEELDAASSDQERCRIVADVIASMTERQVVDLHLRITGQNLGSALDQALL